MNTVIIIFILLAAVAVFAIAAGAIGREAHRLDAISPRAVYVLDDAVDFVADRLPQRSQARLTPAEVEQLLIAHMNWLHERDLAPEGVIDRRQRDDHHVVVSQDELVAALLLVSEQSGIEVLDDVDVVEVVNAHLAYFGAIGAVGPQAPFDDL